MQKWEYLYYASQFIGHGVGVAGNVITMFEKEKENYLTEQDQANSIGRDGWELINVTPLNSGSGTEVLLYIYKRPLSQ